MSPGQVYFCCSCCSILSIFVFFFFRMLTFARLYLNNKKNYHKLVDFDLKRCDRFDASIFIVFTFSTLGLTVSVPCRLSSNRLNWHSFLIKTFLFFFSFFIFISSLHFHSDRSFRFASNRLVNLFFYIQTLRHTQTKSIFNAIAVCRILVCLDPMIMYNNYSRYFSFFLSNEQNVQDVPTIQRNRLIQLSAFNCNIFIQFYFYNR